MVRTVMNGYLLNAEKNRIRKHKMADYKERLTTIGTEN